MKQAIPITTLFLDIGGVVLTDGWDHRARKRAATAFDLDWAEMEARHRMTFELVEEGELALDDYLSLVVFYQKRSFTRSRFRRFMFAQSEPYPDMIDFVSALKARHDLKVVVVSNEGRELNRHRVRTFRLDDFVDVFISSSFVHLRKPNPDIFRLALDVAQVETSEVLYLDNTPMFVHIAEGLGIRSVLHTHFASTRTKLLAFGLQSGGGTLQKTG
jgi:putative hydrolase of the HAD superfamily